MFGTIGHARLKSGSRGQLDALMQEWHQTIRPQIPGEFVQLVGHPDGQPEELVLSPWPRTRRPTRPWRRCRSKMPGSAASPSTLRARCAGKMWRWR